MASWQFRLGLIVPDVNVVVEPEFARMAPAEISIHSSRGVYDFSVPDPLGRLLEDVPRCSRELAAAKVHAIAFACTGASFYKGFGHDAAIAAEITEVAQVPATTTSTAVVEALKALEAQKVALATPYDEWVNEREQTFLESHGFTVVTNEGLGVRDGGAIACFASEDAEAIARRAFSDEADVLFISCTNLESHSVIAKLESELGKPVITSNQATLWHALRLIGWERPIAGFGKLLETIS